MKALALNVGLSLAVLLICLGLDGDLAKFDPGTWIVFLVVAIGVGAMMWLRDVEWDWTMRIARPRQPDEDEPA